MQATSSQIRTCRQLQHLQSRLHHMQLAAARSRVGTKCWKYTDNCRAVEIGSDICALSASSVLCYYAYLSCQNMNAFPLDYSCISFLHFHTWHMHDTNASIRHACACFLRRKERGNPFGKSGIFRLKLYWKIQQFQYLYRKIQQFPTIQWKSFQDFPYRVSVGLSSQPGEKERGKRERESLMFEAILHRQSRLWVTQRAERERERPGEKERGKRERDFVDTAILKPLVYVFTVCS